MTDRRKDKVERAVAEAEMALQLALNAMSQAQAVGAILEALLGVLRDHYILSPSKIKLVFLGAAAAIDSEMAPVPPRESPHDLNAPSISPM